MGLKKYGILVNVMHLLMHRVSLNWMIIDCSHPTFCLCLTNDQNDPD